jgi:hypothetical protein
MDEHDRPALPNPDEDAANEQMVRQMEQRRQARPDRRVSTNQPVINERRRICEYCYQPGDHRTAADCLLALSADRSQSRSKP